MEIISKYEIRIEKWFAVFNRNYYKYFVATRRPTMVGPELRNFGFAKVLDCRKWLLKGIGLLFKMKAFSFQKIRKSTKKMVRSF